MFRPVLATLALVAGSIVLAAPAQAAPYTVTLATSHANRDIGQTLTLNGKVTGTKAAAKKLTVQRRVGTGAWTTLGTVTTTSKRTYTYKHKVTRTGEQAFRVIAPKNGSTTTGVSPSRTLTGYTWLNLTDQPHYVTGTMFIGTTVRAQENSYARSIELVSGSGTREIFWQLDDLCDASDVDVTLNDGTPGSQAVSLSTTEGGTSRQAVAGSLTGANVVGPTAGSLTISVSNTSDNVLVVSPRIHCATSRLPSPTY